MSTYPTAPCTICHRPTEMEFDGETGSMYATRCRACAKAVTEQPYCHNGDCPRQICGTRTRIANPRSVGRGARAVYICDRCGFSGTAIHWAVASSYQSAQYDAMVTLAGGLDLTRSRAKSARHSIAGSYPVGRANGRAYLLGLTHAGITV
jgi:hypothetical protein